MRFGTLVWVYAISLTVNAQPFGNPNTFQNGSPQIYSQDGRYLGNLNANRYDPDSVANPYGRYGSPYSSDSINNPYGRYGSPYSSDSANNPYGSGVRIYGR